MMKGRVCCILCCLEIVLSTYIGAYTLLTRCAPVEYLAPRVGPSVIYFHVGGAWVRSVLNVVLWPLDAVFEKVLDGDTVRGDPRQAGLNGGVLLISVAPEVFGVPACVIFVLLVLLAGAALYVNATNVIHRDNGAGGIRCATCGYNLSHNTSGVCPECGTSVSGSGRQRRI